MTFDSAGAFVEAVRRNRLLPPAQLDELAGPLLAASPDPRQLARELARRGWLTPYQVNQLFQPGGGELLLGSYVLLERLGEGGMGEVYKAHHWKLHKVVALKLLREDRLNRPDDVRRFHREVRAAAQLDHPNVVRAYDADEAGGKRFFVMEYVEGTDLAKQVKRHGPLPVAEACDAIRQAALGLQHAFERGLVHRDVKPHNLLRTPAGVVKLLDLGLARLNPGADDGEASGTMTRDGLVMGSLDYIAPEQALNAHQVDTRADLYSLGCTLYFLLTGQPPYPGGSALEKLTRHQLDQPVPVDRRRPAVPPAVAEVVHRLMAKRPADRYQTPAEAAAALAAALSRSAVALAPAPAGSTSQTVTMPVTPRPAPAQAAGDTEADWSSIVTDAIPEAADPPSGRRRTGPWPRWLWPGLAGGGLTVLGVAALLVVLLGSRRPPAPPPPGPGPTKPKPPEDPAVVAFETWVQKVTAMAAARQAREVGAKLKECNPGFDGNVKPTFEGGAVVALEFNADAVADLRPLRPLRKLKRLACRGTVGACKLADLSPLKGMRLIRLECQGTRVANLQPLEGMPLTWLDCLGTQIADLTPLKGMPLTAFNCENTKVKSLAPLAGLPLETLSCSNTPVEDLSPLKKMPLTVLYCENTKVKSLTPLRELPSLSELKCGGSPVAGLSGLEGLPLTTLLCNATPVADLSPLAGLPQLATLNLDDTKVDDLKPLKGLPLQQLSLQNTAVASLAPLQGMAVNGLNCNNTKVTDLAPLAGNLALSSLRCNGTKVKSLAPLKGLRLAELHCQNTPVDNLEPLKGMMTLNGLDCGQTAVANLSPLVGMPLAWLHLEKCDQINDVAPLKGLPLKDIRIDYQPGRDEAVLRAIKTLGQINGKPAAQFWKEVTTPPKS